MAQSALRRRGRPVRYRLFGSYPILRHVDDSPGKTWMVVILKPKLYILVLVALPAVAATARAEDLRRLLNEKFQIAEIFEAGSYAAEKCPGLRVIEDNIRATADEAGVTDD